MLVRGLSGLLFALELVRAVEQHIAYESRSRCITLMDTSHAYRCGT